MKEITFFDCKKIGKWKNPRHEKSKTQQLIDKTIPRQTKHRHGHITYMTNSRQDNT